MYSFEQSEQLNLFFLSLGTGFVLGIIYDILRAIRLTFSKSKTLIFIFDILYFIIFALFTLIFFLALNKGEFRSYMIFGEILGWIFYYISFGLTAKRITDIFVNILHKVFAFLFKLIFTPFRLLYKVFLKIEHKFSRFFDKVAKKFKKNRKKHLPKLRLYVYNLLGIFGKQQNVKKKEGYNDEEKTS